MNHGLEHDLEYRPGADNWSWLGELTPDRILVLGPLTEATRAAAVELSKNVRVAPTGPWSSLLKHGCYAIRRGRAWHIVIVVDGAVPGPPRRSAYRFDSGDLAFGSKALDAEWDAARELQPLPFQRDDYVKIRGTQGIGTVDHVIMLSGVPEVYVRVNGRIQQFSADALEAVLGDPSDPHYWLSSQPSSAEDFAFALTITKLQNALSDVLYSYSSSKTIFRPYQFIPVIQMLNSNSGRLLIADEVGLGKTIEAGLIWSELEQRSALRRVLVVAPASLRAKWKIEMLRRFDRQLDFLDIKSLQAFAKDLSDGRDPDLCGIISVESLRRPKELLGDLVELAPQFDLVIVDEAHSMRNRGTASFYAGQLLSDWAENLVFLSATPLNLGTNDLFNLLNLLQGDLYADPEVFRDQLEPNGILNAIVASLNRYPHPSTDTLWTTLRSIEGLAYGQAITRRQDYIRLAALLRSTNHLSPGDVATAKKLISNLNSLSTLVTRTRKIDVPDAKAVREPLTVRVDWTESERQFYQNVEALFRTKAKLAGAPPGFIMQMPLRQAASCIPATRQYLSERASMGDFDEVAEWDEGIDGDPEDLEPAEGRQSLLTNDESTALSRSVRRVGDADTKFDALLQRLRSLRSDGLRQVMVFSFFRRTLSYLGARFSPEFNVRVMDGRTPPAEREQIMSDFRAGEFDLLLLSEVGSEGLDFEFCNVLVNYDLPWNPMRVEQRIGRLDRFGQKHDKIFIINMHVPGTIETDIFERLYDRIGIFTRSIGDLEPIMQDEFRDVAKEVLDPRLTAAQRQQRADEIAVAVERRAKDIASLTESKGILAYSDRLEIDGITDSGPSDGRYIGPSEIKRVLSKLMVDVGGDLDPHREPSTYRLRPSDALIQRFAGFAFGRRAAGDARRVQQSLASDRPYLVTFDSSVASRTGFDLLSGRHPLIRYAAEYFAENPALHRFGSVSAAGIEPRRRFFARVDVASSTGLNPRQELWVTAVDAATGDLASSVESALLTALAQGNWSTPSPLIKRPTEEQIEAVDTACALRRREQEARRRAENEALVDARLQAKHQLLDRKIERARDTLDKVTRDGRSGPVIRMHRGRVRNLQHESNCIDGELNGKRLLSLSVRPVAYVMVEGSQP